MNDFLLAIVMYKCRIVKDLHTKESYLQLPLTIEETVASKPTWAQWDLKFQCLYFIYNKSTTTSTSCIDTKENIISTSGTDDELHPMLSALQFHDDLPHETVLNIPVNVPVSLEPFGGYMDDPVPLRIHDGSMDMIVLSDERGMVCVCHHYLYQVVQPPKSGCETVHFAYSVIMLHHATMIHSSVTGVQYSKAVDHRPTFLLIDDYVMVHAPGLFLHFLDTHLQHDPHSHIYLPSSLHASPVQYMNLMTSSNVVIDVLSLSMFNKCLPDSKLTELAIDDQAKFQFKLAILHYFRLHKNQQNALAQILEKLGEQIMDPMTGVLLQEILIGGAYTQTVSNLTSDTICFANLLPYSVYKYPTRHEMKLSRHCNLSITQEDLVNPISVMLLSPQQRLTPYKKDIWNLLYQIQNSDKPNRFLPQTVVNKLLMSLHCYQPEVLSRCSTPLSPSTAMGSNSDILRSLRFKEPLPFTEKEQVTATKQEHITSVNLRELSIHLLKWAGVHGRNTKTPVFVHSVANLYVSAQVEISRWLCYIVTNAARLKCSYVRGFQYIDTLNPYEARMLFLLYDRFNSSCGCIGFPVPPGFSSFFTYLSYRTLSSEMFLQYIERHVLELNMDVLKTIFNDIPEDSSGVQQKLCLLSLLPRSRIKRILNNWNHPVSVILRAKEHSMSILSGSNTSQPRYVRKLQMNSKNTSVGVHTEMLPCFDSFLKLLLAKVNLNELDVQLLLEGTMASLNLN